MRKMLISAALLSAAAVATPAIADHQRDRDWDRRGYHDYGADRRIQARLQNVHHRIVRAIDRHRVSRSEGNSLLREHERIRERYFERRRNGLTRAEAMDLDRRIEALRIRLERDRHDGRRRDRDRDWDWD